MKVHVEVELDQADLQFSPPATSHPPASKPAELVCKVFSGYGSEVCDEIRKWSAGKQGMVVSVQQVSLSPGSYYTYEVWYWK